MDDETLELSEQLAAELDRNGNPIVDPREVPTRFSLLKRMAQSPAHYLHACRQPQDDSLAARLGAFAPERSGALAFGSAVHALILGDKDKVGFYAGRRYGKAWDADAKAMRASGISYILSGREWITAHAIAGAIRRNATAMRLLFDGIVEERIDWTYAGKACRSTPDVRGAAHLADLKTCQSAQPVLFTRQALRLYYHAQAALYGDAIESLGMPRPSDCYLIAVEKTPPHPVTILRITDRALEAGAKLCRLWVEQLLVCEATGVWPEYLQDIGSFDIDDVDELDLEIDGRRFTL